MPIPRRIAIITHPMLAAAAAEAQLICTYLKQQGVEHVIWGQYSDTELRRTVHEDGFDLLISLGGDGTMLRTGHLAAPLGLPVLGINMGRFGFLMEVPDNQWHEGLAQLLEGRYRLESRMMLNAVHRRAGVVLGRWDVLNEVVVARGSYVRPIKIVASVDNNLLATYIADALIAATPTGSTAYALAAGGPILPPELRNILIVPVAPHLSLDRPVILSEGACVTMAVSTTHEAVLSVDGQPAIAMEDGDDVRVGANQSSVQFVRFHDPGQFYTHIMRYMEQNPAAGDKK